MIWIKTQDKMALVECSMVRIHNVTPTQSQILSDRNVTLGEYNSKEESKEIISEIERAIQFKEMVYHMPERKLKYEE